jgi:hypothetical protein
MGIGEPPLLLVTVMVTVMVTVISPLRHPTALSLSLAGVWLVIPDLAVGLAALEWNKFATARSRSASRGGIVRDALNCESGKSAAPVSGFAAIGGKSNLGEWRLAARSSSSPAVHGRPISRPGAVSYVACRRFSGETALVGPRPGRQSRKGSD